jgi:hypothetical protein
METLGISGPPKKDDSFFRRIFWPSEDSVDADMLGQQGFWLCLIVALLTLITATFQGHFVLAILFASFYFLGGVGVREHDLAAANLVAIVYSLNLLATVFLTRAFPGYLTLFAELLLISNIRGCWIASKWQKAGDPDLIPLRMNETWRDKLVDQMPAKVWPRIRITFYALGAVVFLATTAGSIVLIVHGPPTRNAAGTTPDAIVHAQ